MSPGDWNSKCDVKSSERRAHDPLIPGHRGEEGKNTSRHEAQAHHRHDLN
jgi:hypothetical protein